MVWTLQSIEPELAFRREVEFLNAQRVKVVAWSEQLDAVCVHSWQQMAKLMANMQFMNMIDKVCFVLPSLGDSQMTDCCKRAKRYNSFKVGSNQMSEELLLLMKIVLKQKVVVASRWLLLIYFSTLTVR